MAEAVGGIVHQVLLESLGAAEALGGHVIGIRPYVADAPAVDGHFEAAQSFTDTAKGVVGGGHGYPSEARASARFASNTTYAE